MKTDYEDVFKDYPELLRWSHLEKIFGYSRRTIERRRASGRLACIEFVDPFGDGCLQAVKSSVIKFLNSTKGDSHAR